MQLAEVVNRNHLDMSEYPYITARTVVLIFKGNTYEASEEFLYFFPTSPKLEEALHDRNTLFLSCC